jgi:hypothetical protein
VLHEVTVPGGITARFEVEPGQSVEVDGVATAAPVVLGPGTHAVVVSGAVG